jgi:hypothetical protein
MTEAERLNISGADTEAKIRKLEVSMDNETIAINLVTGYLVKNELPTADHVEQIVKQLTNFSKAIMEELGSNDAKRQADRLKRQGRR